MWNWLSVNCKLAFREATATIENTLFLSFPLYQLFSTLRAEHTGFNYKRLRLFAVGITATSQELAETSCLYYHRATTLRANFIRWLSNPYPFYLLGGLAQCFFKRCIEIS